MYILISILAIIFGLVALFLLAGLILKRDYDIVRDILIPVPKQQVFDYIRIQSNQEHYNKWWMADPNLKKEFHGTDGTVGFVVTWDSTNNQVGKGEQEIKKIMEGTRIDFELRFEKPFEGITQTYLATETVGNNTKVTWGFAGKNKYPFNVVYALFGLEKKLADDLSLSLGYLKKVLSN